MNTAVRLSELLVVALRADALPPTFDPAQPLAHLGLDSVRLLELALQIEDTFQFEFPDEELKPVLSGSFDRLVAMIDRHRIAQPE